MEHATIDRARLFDADYFRRPYAAMARLRDTSPVHEFAFPVGDVRTWFVSRYDDVRTVLGDPRFSSEGGTWGNDEFRAAGLVSGAGSVLERAITVVDAPAHTRLRRLAMTAFTPRRVEQWRDTIDAVVTDRLGECAARGRFDVMADYAGPVSATVMGAVLGLQIDRHTELAEALTMAFPTDPARADDAVTGFVRICDYAAELIEDKRDRPADDLASALLSAGEDADRLTSEELQAMIAAFILAGSDTVRSFVGNAVLALLDHPDQLELLASRPDLDAAAIEELLRYEGPLSAGLFRVTTEAIELGDVVIPAGDPVIASLASANRDPRAFDAPDRLDLRRDGRRHVGFGHGLHNCLGAALARIEGQLAIPRLVRELPGLTLAIDREQISHVENWAMRRVVDLPVSCGGNA